AIAARTGRAVDAVQQLAHSDDADRTLLVSHERLKLRGGLRPLPLDENGRVDQDGQRVSGGPTDLRSARSSSANSASTGGAVSRSVRNRSAERRHAFGGVITATGAPARVISISSPAATRLSTSENRRATSVAVSRATTPSYQINLTRHQLSTNGGSASRRCTASSRTRIVPAVSAV